jgi:hypothetical protein
MRGQFPFDAAHKPGTEMDQDGVDPSKGKQVIVRYAVKTGSLTRM